MLPEHNSALADYNKHKLKKLKPTLDEQKLEELTYVINQSIQDERKVLITEFDEFENIIIEGRITRIDQKLRRLRVESDNEVVYIPLEDILQINLDKT